MCNHDRAAQPDDREYTKVPEQSALPQSFLTRIEYNANIQHLEADFGFLWSEA